LTKTENTADQGGNKLAFMAFELATKGKTSPVVAGFSPEQQYFLSNAQGWCGKITDEHLRKLTTEDVHSWNEFRVIGTDVDNPNFAAAFGCALGTTMAPVNHCSVW
jgi:predicted metalloendopeptidase